MDRVLVTGASGYLAGHIVQELREHGYAVRGTVRKPAAHLPADVEQVHADLTSDDGWEAAVDGCRYVIHTASPFPAGVPKDADELVRPAVEGTRRVLRAAKGADRVVLTSSIAAICWDGRVGAPHTEADWSDPDRCTPYARSKTLAERAAWDFDGGAELSVVNPGLLLGPLLSAGVGTSVEAVGKLLNRDVPGSPGGVSFSVADVRDVAAGHRLAMETPGAAGNRYILAGDPVPLTEFAAILAAEFNPRGYRVPTRRIPYWLLWTIGRFDPTVKQVLDYVDKPERVSADKARAELGWMLRPAAESILATAESLIAHGLASK